MMIVRIFCFFKLDFNFLRSRLVDPGRLTKRERETLVLFQSIVRNGHVRVHIGQENHSSLWIAFLKSCYDPPPAILYDPFDLS